MLGMHAIDVIKRPLLTEKSTIAMNEQERYSFLVDPRATKTEIKAAIEKLYKVEVVKINTCIRKARDRRQRFGMVRGALSKKATVRLKEGQRIELF